MKLKMFKTKSILALVLALFMVMSMLMAIVPAVKAQNESGTIPVLSIVPTGAAGSSVTSYIPQSAIGSQFTVDIRLDNASYISGGISGATYGIIYNPAVLQFVSSNDGSCWTSKLVSADVATGSNEYDFAQTIANTSNASATISPGNAVVLGQITFQVIASGQSNITFDTTGNNPFYLVATTGTTTTATSTNLYPTGTSSGFAYANAIYNLQITTISAVLSGTGGTTNQASYQFPSGTNPINNTFSVDLYMNNELNEPVWAWNIGVSWNPAVLQLETITEGSYMNAAPGLYNGSSTLFVPGFIDNIAGTVQQGISDIYLSNTTATNTAGVMCTLTFEVINYANSAITLSPGIPTLVNNNEISEPVNALNNFMYIGSTAPAAQAPTAVITNEGSSTYIAGQPFTMNALSSVPGYDPLANPVNPTVPITGYSWTVTNGGTTIATGTGSSISFNAPSVVNGNIVVSLTVSTATTTDSSYVNTNTATLTIAPGIISPTSAGAQINLYIVNNATTTAFPYKSPTGQGIFNSTTTVDSYAPQQIMNLAAFVEFNGGEVTDKLVTFTIYNSTDVIATFVEYTNGSGIAVVQYRLPNDGSGVMSFGTYEVTATVDVAQVIVSSSFNFQYGYTLTLGQVSVSSLVARGRDHATLSIPITTISQSTQLYYITYTVTDANGVPVYSGEESSTVAGVSGIASSTVSSGSITLPIPIYAFGGTATVHVNIFNANPANSANGALPYCPESDGTFTIGYTPS